MTIETMFKEGMSWPPKAHEGRLLELDRYRALYEGDPDTLRLWAKGLGRKFLLDELLTYPVPEIAARTLGTFLFGEDALVTSEANPDPLTGLLEETHFHALNQEAVVTQIVDGEIYLKLDVDEEVSERAIISTVPAKLAFPLFQYGRLTEVAFVHNLDGSRSNEVKNSGAIWRHVEVRLRGQILHFLYRGSKDRLGRRVSLAMHGDTAALEESLDTEITDLLARHVPFQRTRWAAHGISAFRGKQGLIDAIYGLYTQDQHDAEMAKKRIAAHGDYLKRKSDGRPQFDRSQDVLELSDDARGAVGKEGVPVFPIEFTDSKVQGERIAQRIDEFLLACGIAPQSAGRDVAGGAESGTARRLAQALTLQTVSGAARYWTPSLKDLLDLALYEVEPKLFEKRPTKIKKAKKQPMDVMVQLRDGVNETPSELAERLMNLRTAQLISIEEGVRELHPDWDEKAVAAEVARIMEEEALKVPNVTQFGDEPLDDEDSDVDTGNPGAPDKDAPGAEADAGKGAGTAP